MEAKGNSRFPAGMTTRKDKRGFDAGMTNDPLGIAVLIVL
jgi:hypothetical protein